MSLTTEQIAVAGEPEPHERIQPPAEPKSANDRRTAAAGP